jgi:hypothetical protein
VRLHRDGVHGCCATGLIYSLEVLAGLDPVIGRPDSHAKLFRKKYRADGPAAAQIEHPHSGSEIQALRKPFCEPQNVGAHCVVHEPMRIVFRGTGKMSLEKALVESSGRCVVHGNPDAENENVPERLRAFR